MLGKKRLDLKRLERNARELARVLGSGETGKKLKGRKDSGGEEGKEGLAEALRDRILRVRREKAVEATETEKLVGEEEKGLPGGAVEYEKPVQSLRIGEGEREAKLGSEEKDSELERELKRLSESLERAEKKWRAGSTGKKR